MLKKLASAGGETINLKELGITNMTEMLEDMDENEKILEDLEKPFAEKLAESKAKTQATKDEAMEEQDTVDDSNQNISAQNSRVETSQDAETS